MIQKLVSIYNIKKRYDKLADNSDPVATRREPQCPYRLLNFLFSHRFSEGLLQLGNVADLAALDA